jgi:hypothetical protein
MFEKLSGANSTIQHLAWCAVVAVTLAGCGGDDGTAAVTNGTTSAATQPFIVNGVPPTSVRAGAKYQYIPTAADSDGRALSYAITNKPDWATFGETNGELSGVPTVSDVGTTAAIQIAVSDGTNRATVGPFRITVVPSTASSTAQPSAAPTISGTPPASITAGQSFGFTPVVSAPSGESLSFSIVNMPAWATFNTDTGALAGTPGSASVGTFPNILISVAAAEATVSLPAFSIQVLAAASNAPTIAGNPATTVIAGTPYSFTPLATDPDGNPVTFSIANAPPWASFSAGSGQLSGTPPSADVGTDANIVITVSDGTQSASLAPFAIQVQAPANDTPVISGTPATSVLAGSAYAFTPSATDPPGGLLTFSIQGKPSWAAFATDTGELSGTPTAANVGSYAAIIISASNGSASVALPAFSIQVNAPAGQAPVISGTPPASAIVDENYVFKPTASDPRGNALTFSVVNLPSWASFSSASGQLSGTPGAGDVGSYANIIISVTDGTSSASLAAFSISVTQPAIGSATLTWSIPTQNTNGTPLTNLAGFNIYYGTSASNLNQSVQIANPALTSYALTNLASGTWYFSINDYTTAGTESAVSNIASTTIP